MTSANVTYSLNTIKGHGVSLGDVVMFHGMGSDPIPTVEGTPVKFGGKIGNKYILISVIGEVMTWEFGPSAKVWISKPDHVVAVEARTLDNGDTVYVGKCGHGWETGLHTSEDDARAVATGHGEVTRPLYVSVKPTLPTPDQVETARKAVQDNGRVFAAEVGNWGGQAAFDILVESGTHVLIDDGDMSRYVKARRTADRVEITDGLAVWDYNMDAGTVDLSTMDGDGWFYVRTVKGTTSLMNGERVVTVHPVKGPASDAVAAMVCGLCGDTTVGRDDKVIPFPHECATRADIERFTGDASTVVAPTVEIHTGDGTVITEADVKARFAEAFGPRRSFSDRDLRDQVIAYLGTDVDGFYVDGIVDTIIREWGQAVPIDAIGGGEFSEILARHARRDFTDLPVSEDMGASEVMSGWVARESEVWAGTGTMIKRPIRALMGRRKRKATRVNARRVRGGF